MGLDSVELLMAIEEEFGIEIPDDDATAMKSVNHVYEFLKNKLNTYPPETCLRQRLFFKFRRALMENYEIGRKDIKLHTKLKDVVEQEDLKDGWPFLAVFSDLEYPKFKVPSLFFESKHDIDNLTIGEVLTSLMTVNAEYYKPERHSHDEVWVRLAKVIQYQLNVDIKEIQPRTEFTQDLGID